MQPVAAKLATMSSTATSVSVKKEAEAAKKPANNNDGTSREESNSSSESSDDSASKNDGSSSDSSEDERYVEDDEVVGMNPVKAANNGVKGKPLSHSRAMMSHVRVVQA